MNTSCSTFRWLAEATPARSARLGPVVHVWVCWDLKQGVTATFFRAKNHWNLGHQINVPCSLILQLILGMNSIREKQKVGLLAIVKAFVASVSRWKYLVKNQGSWLLASKVKRSSTGFPKHCTDRRNRSLLRDHSSSCMVFLLSQSTWMFVVPLICYALRDAKFNSIHVNSLVVSLWSLEDFKSLCLLT